ncbi:hypothetical protein fh0823_15700 [Francisella halioticida]|uniref:NAD-dependent epimerase n=1 Tax=Francisella halioticida TaxID=549298 RepID=A0ABN5AXX3_9GAMM|nr:NAD(P)-dependent oxidoreductase [Francisella halioticida]ASG68534.1 NAD-dependent epimerase [Francisella halioticida]BCD91431.1 hypothetical protein fh0823_15700 [Francisella halioticida]
MKKIIIGSGNLSSKLMDSIDEVVNLSSREILASRKELWYPFLNEKIVLVFNNFQASNQLGELSDLENYIERSILCTAIVLDIIKNLSIKIEKIIYTSTCALYGNNMKASEYSEIKVENLYTSSKRTNEFLIKQFCMENDVDYTIIRLFNMYGGEDYFSIISKIRKSIKYKTRGLKIINPDSIRDFIHIDDVVNIYEKIIKTRGLPILNVGTGIATSLGEILDMLGENNKQLIEVVENVDLKIVRSCSDNLLLNKIIGDYEFIKVKDFLEMEC